MSERTGAPMTSEQGTRTPKPEAQPGFTVYSCELCINGSYWNEAQNQVMRCGYCGGIGWITRRDSPKTPTVTEVAGDVRALAATVAEHASQIQQLMGKFNTWVPPTVSSVEDHEQRLAALESPGSAEAAPEPVCQCGHSVEVHPDFGSCWHRSKCDCRKFVPAEQAVNQEPPALDPVLVAIRTLYENIHCASYLAMMLRQEWRVRFGIPWSAESARANELDRVIRAYGADAREGQS